MSTQDRIRFNSPFIETYLDYVEDTESPRIFHVYSALSAIAACLGRRVYLPYGIANIYPNMFVALVGPPGVRKSTAISIARKLLVDNTAVRFAPDDTSGMRQGLIAAIEGRKSEFPDDDTKEIANALDAILAGDAEDATEKMKKINVYSAPADAHVLYINASELSTFLGQNSVDMLTFLLKMWDGEDYEYRLKNTQAVLKDPLLNLIGATTPTSIATSMPPEAMGQGFMSRLLLVFGNRKYKSVPIPEELDLEKKDQLKKVLNKCSYDFHGPFKYGPNVRDLLIALYEQEPEIEDTRFLFYKERRQQHLIKLAMAFTASRLSNTMEQCDLQDAEKLLRRTEKYMPDALGEYGLSPLAHATQKIVEFLQVAKEPVSANVLWSLMMRDMRSAGDFMRVMTDLLNSGKVIEADSATHGKVYIAKSAKKSFEDQEVERLLTE